MNSIQQNLYSVGNNPQNPIQQMLIDENNVLQDLEYFQQNPQGIINSPRLAELAADLNALQQDEKTLQSIANGPDSSPYKIFAQQILANEPFLAIDADLNQASLGGITLFSAANEFSPSNKDLLANLLGLMINNQPRSLNYFTTLENDLTAFDTNPYGKNPSSSSVDPNLPLLEGELALLNNQLNYAKNCGNLTDQVWLVDAMLNEISSTIQNIYSLLEEMGSNPAISNEPSYQKLMNDLTEKNIAGGFPSLSLIDAANSSNKDALANMLVSMVYIPNNKLTASGFQSALSKFIYENPLT